MEYFIEKRLEVIFKLLTNLIIARVIKINGLLIKGIIMKSLIFHCKDCDRYTLYPSCPKCGAQTVQPAPPRFSPEDKYGKYRRQLRFEQKLQN